MGFRWDAKQRTYVYTKPKRKRSKNYNYNRAIKNKNTQISTNFENLDSIWNKIAPKMEQLIKQKEDEENDKKIINENREKAKELVKKIKKYKLPSGSFVEDAISSAKKKAKKLYESRGTSKDEDGNFESKSQWLYAGAEIAESALNFATQSARFAYNRYITLNEDYITKQAVTNAMDSINRVKKMGSSVINGMVKGASTGGVVGAVIGGVTSAIDFGVNQYFEYQQRMSSYYQQLNATNFQTNLDASRLGLIGSSGTEN